MIEIIKQKGKQRCMFCTSKTDNTTEILTGGFVNRLTICDDCKKELYDKLKIYLKEEKIAKSEDKLNE